MSRKPRDEDNQSVEDPDEDSDAFDDDESDDDGSENPDPLENDPGEQAPDDDALNTEEDRLVDVEEPDTSVVQTSPSDPEDTPLEIAPGSPSPEEAIAALIQAGPAERDTWTMAGESSPFGGIDVRVDTSGADGRDGQDGKRGRDGKDGKRLKKGGRGRGGNGTSGSAGRAGTMGKNARKVKVRLEVRGNDIWLTGTGGSTRVVRGVDVDASGGRGGNGGDGGRGGRGGSGSPSGSSGRDGPGGDGKDGGDGADVEITTDDAHLLGLIRSINCAGGRGGDGGSGSPSGGRGRSGADGAVFLRLDDGEESDDFGVEVRALDVGFDGSRLAGCLTRGTAFVVESARVRNASSIPIEGPFDVLIASAGPLVEQGEGPQVSRNLDGGGTVSAKGGTSYFGVPRDAAIGTWTLLAWSRSERAGVSIRLNKGWVAQTFTFDVNHRLRPSPPRVDPTTEGPTLDRLMERLDPLRPSAQLSTYSGLLAGLLFALAEPTGPAAHRVQGAGSQLTGALFDADVFDRTVESYFADADLPAKARVVQAVVVHFFRTMPRSTREKTFDAAYWIASGDRWVSPEERTALLELSTALGFDEPWVLARFPPLAMEAGGAVGPERTNRPMQILVPLVAASVFAAVRALAINQGWMMPAAMVLPAGLSPYDPAVAACAAAVALVAVRRTSFHAACPQCGGLSFRAIEVDPNSPLGRESDAHVCRTCGARWSSADSGPHSLLHNDRGFAPDTRWLGPTLSVGLLCLSAFGVWSARAPLAVALAVGAAVAAAMSPLTWLPSARSSGPVWRALAAAVFLGIGGWWVAGLDETAIANAAQAAVRAEQAAAIAAAQELEATDSAYSPAEAFAAHCAACHGTAGSGGSAPRLDDTTSRYGNDAATIEAHSRPEAAGHEKGYGAISEAGLKKAAEYVAGLYQTAKVAKKKRPR